MTPRSALRFVFAALCVFSGCRMFAQQSSSTSDAHRLKIHMVGNGHIDPVWLWPWPEGVSVVHSTFRSALDRMKETPDFVFTASSAQFYEWVAANDPAMFTEIKQRVREGRWGVVGGWWVEPDLNTPSGEALVRQGLYGQRSLKRLFGRYAETGFNPDGFGHPGSLPQILSLQGLKNYVFMRPNPGEKPDLPASLFWWRSADGSKVLTYRIPFGYNDKGDIPGLIQRISAMKGEMPIRMAFYGVGDHGGGPTKRAIAAIEKARREQGSQAIVYSTPDRFFAEHRRSTADTLSVVDDELQHHAVGCYSLHSEIKKLNRTAEQALGTAEKISAVGALAWGAAYPKKGLTTAWQRVLLNQFHDSLAGTSLPEHDATARAWYLGAVGEAEEAMYLAAQRLAWQVPATDPDSTYLMAFNPHSWPIEAPIEYDLKLQEPQKMELQDEAGNRIPFQLLPSTTEVEQFGLFRLLAVVKLPPFGYRQFRFRPAEKRPANPTLNSGSVRNLENEFLRATFDKDGRLTLTDKSTGAAVVQGAGAIVLDDPSDTWSHGVKAFDKRIGEFGGATFKVLETGPVRQSIRVETTFGKSRLIIEWRLYQGRKTIEANVWLDWREQLKMLKLTFPTGITGAKATYETAYGTVVRGANGDEEPGLRWLDISGHRNGRPAGLAVINDAKYGYSVSGAEAQVSVLRSPPYGHHVPLKLDLSRDHLWMDQGTQTFRMKLVPHQGDWREAEVPLLAEQFTAPLPLIQQGIHPGTRPQSDSFLSIDVKNVIVSAIKRSETGEDLILRCFETSGKATRAKLQLRFASKEWTGEFRPHEIKTLRFTPTTGLFKEVNLLEE